VVSVASMSFTLWETYGLVWYGTGTLSGWANI